MVIIDGSCKVCVLANGDGLHTMVTPMKDKLVNYTW